MAEKERSLIAYEYYRESLLKFEYFFTGLIGILCAYISQNFNPEKINLSHNTLELFSFIIFIVSFGLSLLRLSKIIQGYKLNHRELHLYELKGILKGNLLQAPEKSQFNRNTGVNLSPQEAEGEIIEIDNELPSITSNLNKLKSTTKSLNKWRNSLFVLGFALLIVSKVWSAYSV